MSRVVIGFHAVEQFLRHPAAGMELSFDRRLKGKRVMQLLDLARKQGVRTTAVSSSDLQPYGSERDHRGVVLLIPPGSGDERRSVSLGEFLAGSKEQEQSVILFLDGITDPHNLGAILRSADQFHIDAVVVPGRRSSQVNETVMKVSAGAAKYVTVITVVNLVQALKDAQRAGYWVFAADMGGETLQDVDLTGKTALVLGAEGKGVSRMAREMSDRCVTIPCQGHIDSLNVSVAAGILLYEITRQRGWKV